MSLEPRQQRGVVVLLADAVGEQDHVTVRRLAREQLVQARLQPPVDVGAAVGGHAADAREHALHRGARRHALHREDLPRCAVEADDAELVAARRDELRGLSRRALRHRHLGDALAAGGVGHAAGAIQHELDRKATALQIAGTEARNREQAVERAVRIPAQRVGMAPAEREQAEAAVLHGSGERADLARAEQIGRNVVEHDRVHGRVVRCGARQRGGSGDGRAHSARGEDRRDRRRWPGRRHDHARRRTDLDARRERIVLRPLVVRERHTRAEGVPAGAHRRVRERERVLAAAQLDDLTRGLAPVERDRQRRLRRRRRANRHEQRDRVALVHGRRRVQAGQRRVAPGAGSRAARHRPSRRGRARRPRRARRRRSSARRR